MGIAKSALSHFAYLRTMSKVYIDQKKKEINIINYFYVEFINSFKNRVLDYTFTKHIANHLILEGE